ncbi:MAG: hypothetical protein M5U28_41045 [Sandaracinaceae bacterium]|nr:hypothetical protein [Sandaracinaceae bacterium]
MASRGGGGRADLLVGDALRQARSEPEGGRAPLRERARAQHREERVHVLELADLRLLRVFAVRREAAEERGVRLRHHRGHVRRALVVIALGAHVHAGEQRGRERAHQRARHLSVGRLGGEADRLAQLAVVPGRALAQTAQQAFGGDGRGQAHGARSGSMRTRNRPAPVAA